MDASLKVNDWQTVGIATIGGAAVIGGELIMFQFRSKQADFLGEYLYIGAGAGVGGSLNGGIAPSPSDFYHHDRYPNYWSDIKAKKAFSADDLNLAAGKIHSAGVSAMYGYSLMYITAGIIDKIFETQSVGGWGIGVGANITFMPGLWKRLSSKAYY